MDEWDLECVRGRIVEGGDDVGMGWHLKCSGRWWGRGWANKKSGKPEKNFFLNPPNRPSEIRLMLIWKLRNVYKDQPKPIVTLLKKWRKYIKTFPLRNKPLLYDKSAGAFGDKFFIDDA